MNAVFLSASVPDPRRDPRYHATADLVAIRDAVRALATVVLPHAALHWGGHPAITPLIRVVAESMGVTGPNRIRLFQSAWFSDKLPDDNAAFQTYELTNRGNTEEASLEIMRFKMLDSAPFRAGVFIGGMEGVEAEFDLFRRRHPQAKLLPIASTGGAALHTFRDHQQALDLPTELLSQYAYPSLFRRLLNLSSTAG